MSVDKSKVAEILTLQGVDIPTDFAWGGLVKNVACSLKKLQVDNNNEYSTPLTLKDVNALKEAGTFVAATHTWEFDANRISIPEPNLSALTAMLLGKLGFHSADLDIKFDKMTLCGTEGKFPSIDAGGKPDKFATMMVQIPLEGGFQGGRFHVYRQHQGKSFDFTLNSHETFYASIFYADCRHEMEQIKNGWRLVMVCDLSWKTSLKDNCSSDELLPFCKTLKKLRDVLEPWEQSDKPRLLAVPLEQKFSESDLSFSTLKDRYQWMVNLFRSTNWVDVHLTVLVKHQQWTLEECHCFDDDDYGDKYKRLGYECDYDHEKELTETYETSKLWLGVNNKPIRFEKLQVNTGKELIGAVDNLFTGEPDKKRGPDDDLSDCWYYRAVLVVWPKETSLEMAFEFGFDGVFDLLKRLAENPSSEEAVDALHQVLAYCQEHPGHLWSRDSLYYSGGSNNYNRRITRLLKICIQLDAQGESLEVLNQLATELKTVTDGHDYYSRFSRAGVLSNEVSECIAELVSIYGWEYYSAAVYRLLSPKWIENQIWRCVHFVFCLLEHQCVEAAGHCGRQVVSLISDSSIDQLDGTDLLACVSAILKMDENPSTSHLAATEPLIGKLGVLKMEKVCHLIINLRKSRESLLKSFPKSLEFYRRLCAHLLTRDFISNGRLNHEIRDVFELLKCYVWLFDFNLIQSFLKKLMEQKEVLRSIVLSKDLREAFVSTSEGKKIFVKLIDFQIAELQSKIVEPEFTWEQQPGTIFSRHLPVQEFLRSSSMQSLTYTNFSGINDARSFAAQYFGRGSIMNGYSATAQTGGVGRNAYCRIVKTRDLYDSRLRQCQSFRQQLASLKEVRHQLDYSPEPGPDAKRLRVVKKEEP